MDIKMLNKYTTEIYLGNEKSLELLLVDIDNIIEKLRCLRVIRITHLSSIKGRYLELTYTQ